MAVPTLGQLSLDDGGELRQLVAEVVGVSYNGNTLLWNSAGYTDNAMMVAQPRIVGVVPVGPLTRGGLRATQDLHFIGDRATVATTPRQFGIVASDGAATTVITAVSYVGDHPEDFALQIAFPAARRPVHPQLAEGLGARFSHSNEAVVSLAEFKSGTDLFSPSRTWRHCVETDESHGAPSDRSARSQTRTVASSLVVAR